MLEETLSCGRRELKYLFPDHSLDGAILLIMSRDQQLILHRPNNGSVSYNLVIRIFTRLHGDDDVS